MIRYATAISIWLCRLVFVLAIVWPTLALLRKCVSQGAAPSDGFTFTSRQWLLLLRSVWMASVATVGAMVLALPAARVLGRLGTLRRGTIYVSALLLLLLCPPTVYAFGWERLLPAEFNPYVRCIGVWMLWSWPVPAVILGLGWARSGKAAYEAALLDTTGASAFMTTALPVMGKYLALSAAVLFLFLLGEYGVPHACALQVFATELLGWAASSGRAIDVVWPALSILVVTMAALLIVLTLWRRCAADEPVDAGERPPSGRAPIAVAYTLILFGAGWGVPLASLVARMGGPAALGAAFTVYGRDLAWSLGVASASAIIAVAMGVALAMSRGWRSVGLFWSLAFGMLPGALVGEALIAAYNKDALWWLYDYAPIVGIGYLARFGWVGVLVGYAIVRGSPRHLSDQARVDGATKTQVTIWVQVPLHLSLLLGGAAVVVALSMAEIATTSLVRVPGYAPISLVLVEKFHRFEDGMLASLSLWLVACCLPGVVFVLAGLRRSRS